MSDWDVSAGYTERNLVRGPRLRRAAKRTAVVIASVDERGVLGEEGGDGGEVAVGAGDPDVVVGRHLAGSGLVFVAEDVLSKGQVSRP